MANSLYFSSYIDSYKIQEETEDDILDKINLVSVKGKEDRNQVHIATDISEMKKT